MRAKDGDGSGMGAMMGAQGGMMMGGSAGRPLNGPLRWSPIGQAVPTANRASNAGDHFPPEAGPNTEAYETIVDNPLHRVANEPLSTFSIDVDTASYSNVRRFLSQNQLPPRDAVRIEELLNYSRITTHPLPEPATIPSPSTSRSSAAPGRRRTAWRGSASRPGRSTSPSGPPATSSSWSTSPAPCRRPNKLPLVPVGTPAPGRCSSARTTRSPWSSTRRPRGWFFPPTSCLHKAEILSAIEQLQAGGFDQRRGGDPARLRRRHPELHQERDQPRHPGHRRRLNVGVTSQDDLIRPGPGQGPRAVYFLSVLGFGRGDLKDPTLEHLADKGNGHYAYIHSPREAYKVLVEEMGATLLVTVAKDVKIQVEFKPGQGGRVPADRLREPDHGPPGLNDDTKDGRRKSGRVIMSPRFYEIVPPGQDEETAKVDPLKYTKNTPSGLSQQGVPSRQAAVQAAGRRRPAARSRSASGTRGDRSSKVGRPEIRLRGRWFRDCCCATPRTREA